MTRPRRTAVFVFDAGEPPPALPPLLAGGDAAAPGAGSVRRRRRASPGAGVVAAAAVLVAGAAVSGPDRGHTGRPAPSPEAGTAARMIAVAREQVGYRERGDGWTRFGAWYAAMAGDAGFASADWCDMFVSWVAEQAGAAQAVGRHAWTPSHARWFRSSGRWGSVPRVGAVVFYDWAGSRSVTAIDHVGLVVAVPDGTGRFVAIEGNVDGGQVREKRRSGRFVVGFGYPAYKAR